MSRHAERGRLAKHRADLAGYARGVKEVITRSDVPPPTLPFSAGIRANGFVFTAGQVGADPQTGKVVGPDVDSQTRQTIANLCLAALASGHPTFVIANNKAEGSAPCTVFRLAEDVVQAVAGAAAL